MRGHVSSYFLEILQLHSAQLSRLNLQKRGQLYVLTFFIVGTSGDLLINTSNYVC